MRQAAFIALLPILLPAVAAAETIEINQNAWLNYTVIVDGKQVGSSLVVNQRGYANGISSVQLAGESNAEIQMHQRGRRNSLVVHQSGWITSSIAVQEALRGDGGARDLPMMHTVQTLEENYLSYFQSGGFSLVTLTDPGHTWISRFGRSR